MYKKNFLYYSTYVWSYCSTFVCQVTMRASIFFFFIICLLSAPLAIAQRSKNNTNTSNNDCSRAKPLDLNICHVIQSRKGFGKLQEYKNKKFSSLFSFEREHNSHWFIFTAPNDGVLTFELSPDTIIDDYDWLLYKIDDPIYCPCIKSKQAVPIRGNIARNDRKQGSKTGMALGYTNEFAPAGPGNNFSKPLDVLKGEQFYLVVDDNYRKGSSFEIEVSIPPPKPKAIDKDAKLKKIKVSGKVTDAASTLPIKGKVTVELDTTGKVVSTVFSDSLTGEYSLVLPARKYVFTIESDGFMQKSESVNYRKVNGTEVTQNYALDSIKVGTRANFYNIRFQPNKAIIKPTSEPELERVYNFLKNNPGVFIDVKGHTNSNKLADQYFLQKLSYRRAEAVRDFLVQKGIETKRITFKGMGGTEPLVVSDDFEKAQVNSRVEIVITNVIN